MYNKCISLWLIVLTIIIMTFCVSHQTQLDNVSATIVVDDDGKSSDGRNNAHKIINDFKGDVNVAEIITQSDSTAAIQNLSMIKSTNLGE